MANTTNTQRAFHEVWYLKFNDPDSQRALWLRFSLLTSRNGFKRIVETWAIYFHKVQNREIKKIAAKQTYDLSSFSKTGEAAIRINECELNETQTQGKIQSKGNLIQWNLSLFPRQSTPVNFVPKPLTRFGLTQTSITTLCEDLVVSGTTQINGETIVWKDAIGILGHMDGSKNGHSWIWGQCNIFTDERGNSSDFIFEGLTARMPLGPVASPRLSSFYFFYKGKHYFFNTLHDAFYIKSKNTLTDWSFRVDRDDISFRGFVKAEHKDFVGLTYEDTNGSLLYGATSKLSNMRILVYRAGKLESTVVANNTVAFEIVSRDRNPYVPLLI